MTLTRSSVAGSLRGPTYSNRWTLRPSRLSYRQTSTYSRPLISFTRTPYPSRMTPPIRLVLFKTNRGRWPKGDATRESRTLNTGIPDSRAMARASAPGKLILFGEHAVVFGEPALATAIDLRTEVFARLHDEWLVDGASLEDTKYAYVRCAAEAAWKGPPLWLEIRSMI